MLQKLPIVLVTLALANTSVLWAQTESTLPRKSAQPREAIQPTTTTAPLLKPKPPLDRTPRLTDGATDEEGNALESRDDGVTGPVEVLTNRPRTSTAVLRGRNPDLVVATWIAIANHEEIALAELGAQRAHTAAVRDYAAAMISEHQAAMGQLRRFAPEAIHQDYLNTNARDARTEEVVIRNRNLPKGTPAEVGPVIDRLADGQPPEPDLAPGPTRTTEIRPRLGAEAPAVAAPEIRIALPAGRDFNIVQVERALAVQGLASSKEMLASKTGPEFDQCFLAQQVAIHKALRDKLIVYQRYTTSDLAKVLASNELATVSHLTQANELLKNVVQPVPEAPLPKNP
ncbi:MAG: DUF4142 domain-containing protein [Planctomycetota bacterium]